MFKKLLKIIYVTFSRVWLSMFYSSKYLKGRWFVNQLQGWRWAHRNVIPQKVFGFNRHVPWPVNPSTVVGNPNNIMFSVDDINNFQQTGCYFQCWNGKITIGKGTYIAANVGLITENHDVHNLDNHLDAKDIIIGSDCWVGMNSVILPGVVLGNQTVVGAGAVVSKSFPNGKCIIAGIPAEIIKYL